MAGGTIATENRGRRGLDSEINMIPMVDLMMVTIAFLLITAVWTHFQRVDASALVPGIEATTPPKPVPRLHVEMRDASRFVLHWNDGKTVIRTLDVPRTTHAEKSGDGALRFPELASALESEWRAAGSHKEARDRDQDQLVLHTGDDLSYAAVIAAIDAAYAVKRSGPSGARMEAFAVTFATN